MSRSTSYLLGVFITLVFSFALIQAYEKPSFKGSSNFRQLTDINSNRPQTPTSHLADYKLVKQYYADDKTYHYIANYSGTGTEDTYGNSRVIRNLHMTVAFHDENTFRIKIFDEDNKRWEIPSEYPFVEIKNDGYIISEGANCEVHVQNEPFSLWITRKSTGDIIFDTRHYQLVFTEYFIELTTSLPSKNVFGFGERNYKFKLSPGTYTIWGRDDPMILEDGNGGANTYSHHPVGLIRDQNKNWFLTLMRNSNAMDVIVGHQDTLTYKMVGGIIDIVFFIGEKKPDPVLVAYHKYLGNFTMMPFWSMGFHQSKWGYETHGIMQDIVQNYIHNDIPLDAIWSDIDYMIDKEIFTVDTRRYPPQNMQELTSKFKKKWVPIIDPGVKIMNVQGPGLQTGLERDIFIKNYQGQNLVGSVWAGRCHFVDFYKPHSEQYWSDMLDVLYKIIPFHGIWTDMNEVANFVDGEEMRWDQNVYDQIPYIPGGRPLKRKTLSLDAVHHGGIKEYDTHTLFGIQENAATYKFLKTKSKLPFILTRASAVGIGKYVAHWTGDNGAHWEFLQISIPGNFNFQIFGAPFVGADICGFMDNTDAELCARWMQLGALYPFARNHHEDRTRNQEPWTFWEKNQEISVTETSRIALKVRYSILKWYYSLFIETNGAGSVFRPLAFEFPEDDKLFEDGFNDWEFLLGKGLLCTPKTQPGEPFVNAYFPMDTWYNLFTGEKIIFKEKSERILRVETPFNAAVPLFLRAGHIIHQQNVEKVLSTEDLNDEFEFVVAVDKAEEGEELQATGAIMGVKAFTDDNIHDRCMEENCLYNVKVLVPANFKDTGTLEVLFTAQKEGTKFPLDDIGVKGFKLYGLPIDFMTEDEKNISYVLVSKTSGLDGSITVPDVIRIEQVKDGAIKFTIPQALRVQDGDKITLEIAL